MNNLVYVQFNAKLRDHKGRQAKDKDSLISKEDDYVHEWMNDIDANDEEVFARSGLKWGLVEEASGAVETFELRKTNRTNTSTSTPQRLARVNEFELCNIRLWILL